MINLKSFAIGALILTATSSAFAIDIDCRVTNILNNQVLGSYLDAQKFNVVALAYNSYAPEKSAAQIGALKFYPKHASITAVTEIGFRKSYFIQPVNKPFYYVLNVSNGRGTLSISNGAQEASLAQLVCQEY